MTSDDTEHEQGLHDKYEVRKNGEIQSGCFVLQPASDKAARSALLTYAEEIENETLAEDIRDWVDVLEGLDATREKFVEGGQADE